MKILNKNIFYTFTIIILGFLACKKDKTTNGLNLKDNVTASDYVYNLATKNLTPSASIAINVKSEVGVKFVYNYLMRTGLPDSLINITYATADNQKDLNIDILANIFEQTNMTNASGIKSMIKRLDNSSDEAIIKLTSFQPPLPILANFPASKLPDANDKILITGNASSETGLNKIEILDDSSGSFTVVTTIDNLNGAKTYDVNYDYTYRANTANVKLIVYDTFGITAEVIISVPALPYTLYQNISMGSQGTATETVLNNHFFTVSGLTAGTCDLPTNETALDFLYYGTNNGGTFYAPTNVTNVQNNFRCNGVNNYWAPNAASLKPTRFRVLVPDNGGAIDALYAKFNANTIADLNDDGFFNGISVPGGSTARFGPTISPSTTAIFNATTAYLIWVRVPTTPAATVYKNCIIRVREGVNASTAALSTIKFDIYVQK
ncbi:hypothetical protein [Pedobacter alpinus]|uniref:DUF4397 domain-containing protein n=1 Tax=Pedobacter alpinus TaxID=1590643 RepID=A0ABW5TXD1_9SPHI